MDVLPEVTPKKSPFSPSRGKSPRERSSRRSDRRRRCRSDSRSEESRSKRKRRKSPSRKDESSLERDAEETKRDKKEKRPEGARRRKHKAAADPPKRERDRRGKEEVAAPEEVRREGGRRRRDIISWTERKPRARSPQDGRDPDEEWPPCEHCGKPLTKSGRAQHKWTSVACLQYQFWNKMSEKSQQHPRSWEKARGLAKKLQHERMQENGGAAPHAREQRLQVPRPPSVPPPPPPRERGHGSLRLKERSPEFEDVPLEPEPVRPASSGKKVSRSEHPAEPPSPPRASSVAPSVTQEMQPRAHSVAPSVTQDVQPSGSQAKQLTINITL